MTPVAVGPLMQKRGFDLHRRDVKPIAEIVDLRQALSTEFGYEAMAVMYTVRGATQQPRINQGAFTIYPGTVECWVLFADWDRRLHAPWSSDDEALEAARSFLRRPALATAGVYVTKHGLRIVQELGLPIAAHKLKPVYTRWLKTLEQAGIGYDTKACAVSNLFRMPHVERYYPKTKTHETYRSPGVLLDQMRPIELGLLPEDELAASRPSGGTTRSRPTKLAIPRVETHAREISEPWRWRVEPIASAVLAEPEAWHGLFLALAGALLSVGVPPTELVAMVQAISRATAADDKPNHREEEAQSTLDRAANGQPFVAMRRLKEQWRNVALTLDDAKQIQSEQDLQAWRQQRARRERPLTETLAALRNLIRTAPDGVTLVKGDCGLGKTAELQAVAVERARVPYKTEHATGLRVPLHSVTVLSVDKHELGKQCQRDLAAHSVDVARLFGPLSIVNNDGTPACHYHRTARALIKGGLSMRWELCDGHNEDPCKYRDTCSARHGIEGPEKARVWIGPHALLGALTGKAGATGLLAVDEPPAPLDIQTFTVDDFEAAESIIAGSYLDLRYAAAMRPALEAFRSWFDTDSSGQLRQPKQIGRAYRAAVDAVSLRGALHATGCMKADVAVLAQAALDPKNKSRSGPPLRPVARFLAKQNAAFAERCGTGLRLINALHHVLTTERRAVGRIDRERSRRSMVLASPNEALAKALEHRGAVLLLDANADVNRPIYSTLLGCLPALHVFEAPDGALIERTHIKARGANRTGWMPGGQLDADDNLVRAVTEELSNNRNLALA